MQFSTGCSRLLAIASEMSLTSLGTASPAAVSARLVRSQLRKRFFLAGLSACLVGPCLLGLGQLANAAANAGVIPATRAPAAKASAAPAAGQVVSSARRHAVAGVELPAVVWNAASQKSVAALTAPVGSAPRNLLSKTKSQEASRRNRIVICEYRDPVIAVTDGPKVEIPLTAPDIGSDGNPVPVGLPALPAPGSETSPTPNAASGTETTLPKQPLDLTPQAPVKTDAPILQAQPTATQNPAAPAPATAPVGTAAPGAPGNPATTPAPSNGGAKSAPNPAQSPAPGSTDAQKPAPGATDPGKPATTPPITTPDTTPSKQAPRATDPNQPGQSTIPESDPGILFPSRGRMPSGPIGPDGTPVPGSRSAAYPKPIVSIKASVTPRFDDMANAGLLSRELPGAEGGRPSQQVFIGPKLPGISEGGWSYSTCYGRYLFLCHGPLYFEDTPLERYGESYCLAQPFVSAGKFFGTLPMLPYKVYLNEFGPECFGRDKYGMPRPGMAEGRFIPPYNTEAAIFQAGVVVGLIFLLP